MTMIDATADITGSSGSLVRSSVQKSISFLLFFFFPLLCFCCCCCRVLCRWFVRCAVFFFSFFFFFASFRRALEMKAGVHWLGVALLALVVLQVAVETEAKTRSGVPPHKQLFGAITGQSATRL